jgi:hypothetical protein
VRPGLIVLAFCAYLMNAWAAPAFAGTAQASFAVRINLNTPLASGSTGSTASSSGYCISQTLSLATNAVVRVVCGSNQFVSIEPMPGSAFSTAHGGAYRYMLEPSTLMPADDPLRYMGAGTITTLHIFHEEGQEDTMEMLVSF